MYKYKYHILCCLSIIWVIIRRFLQDKYMPNFTQNSLLYSRQQLVVGFPLENIICPHDRIEIHRMFVIHIIPCLFKWNIVETKTFKNKKGFFKNPCKLYIHPSLKFNFKVKYI